jgi:hypothetical protein
MLNILHSYSYCPRNGYLDTFYSSGSNIVNSVYVYIHNLS